MFALKLIIHPKNNNLYTIPTLTNYKYFEDVKNQSFNLKDGIFTVCL